MRRRLSLMILVVFVLLGFIVSMRYLPRGTREASAVSGDSTALVDSAVERERRAGDTTCFASRIGLPCDPR